MKCSSCRNVTKGGPRLHCFARDPEDNKYCAFFTPMTNGDRIRVQPGQELEWLQQPVEEDAE